MKKNKKWFICRDIMTMCALNRKVKKGKIKAKNIISIHPFKNGAVNEVEVFYKEMVKI